MLIDNQTAGFSDAWPYTQWCGAYGRGANTSCAIVSDGDGTPDGTALVVVRVHVPEVDVEDQKYVVGVHFCSLGDMVTLDIVSIDGVSMHHENTSKHSANMGWWTPSAGDSQDDALHTVMRKLHNTQRHSFVPFLYAGGHLAVNGGAVSFFDTSGDYGNMLLGANANDIAHFALNACGMVDAPNAAGTRFMEGLLSFLLANKLTDDFYGRLVRWCNEMAAKPSPQHIAAMVMSATADRMIEGADDFAQVIIAEFGKISSVALTTATPPSSRPEAA